MAATWLVPAAAAGPAPLTQPSPNAAVDIGSLPVKDANRKFLCNYGYALSFSGFSSGNSTDSWNVAAVPIIGTGKFVNKIVVADTGDHEAQYGFYVELLENQSKSNRPGRVIFSAQVYPRSIRCAEREVPIPPTRLKYGKTYWVEEFAAIAFYVNATWQYDKKRPNEGISQLRSCGPNGCRHNAWQAIPGDYEPYVRVK